MFSIKAWKTKNSVDLINVGFTKLRKDICELPDGREMPGYYVVEMSNWVNVVALTEDKKIIFVEQYRHAAGIVTLEIPGGNIDRHIQEKPEAAVLRELKEETGYEPKRIEELPMHYPNPALLNNKLYSFLALDCKQVSNSQPDAFEDLKIHTLSIEEVEKYVQKGTINHSLILASLFLAWPKLLKI